MQPLKLLMLTIFVLAISCSKQSSPNPDPNPSPNPPGPPPPGSTTKYVKSEVATFSDNSTNQHAFTYDSQHRLTNYTQTVISSSSGSLNVVYEYNISYSGNNTSPDGYTMKISHGASSSVTLTNSLTYNSSNQIIKDSTIACTLSSYSGIRTIYYDYGANLAVAKTIYSNNSSANTLDSTVLDGNGNRTGQTYGKLDLSNTFTLLQIETSTFTNTLNPFYNTSFDIVLNMINSRGSTDNKYLESASTYTNYSGGSVTGTSTNTAQWTMDAMGYILKATVTQTGIGSLEIDYAYY